jgi:RimJ/RimL family protein N-acetyltransferase
VIPGWKYQTESTALIPYNKAWPVFPDGLLGHLYLRSKQDNLIGTVFNTKGMEFDAFVTYMASDKVIAQIYCLQEGDQLTPIGYCFLHSVDGDDGCRLALFGFCFFREYWGRTMVRDLVWMCLDYWFHVLKVDVLYGITRKDNFLARNFSRNFGFKEIAVLPKFLYSGGVRVDARLVLLERNLFTRPEWLHV